MKTADFYQSTADALGVALYLYPDGSVTNHAGPASSPLQRSSLTSTYGYLEPIALGPVRNNLSTGASS